MKPVTIDLKPLSVNDAWQGRRYKTDEYERYERSMLWLLPRLKLPDPPFMVYYEYGLSNVQSDFDNPTKQFQDCLSKKYGFNDRDIYLGVIRKVKVKKGEEYVRFRIEHFDGDKNSSDNGCLDGLFS